MRGKVRNRLLFHYPRLAAATANDGRLRPGQGGLVRAHRVHADDAHAKRKKALRDVRREPGVVEVVVCSRSPRAHAGGGRCVATGAGSADGGKDGTAPITAPPGAEEDHDAGTDMSDRGLDAVPCDALARLLVRDVQDEGREDERARWELVDGGAVTEKV